MNSATKGNVSLKSSTFGLGPLIIDIEGTALTAEDADLLRHPAVGGIILFKRNFVNKHQITRLIAQIRTIRADLLISVDQEGGRVQRFQEGFSRLPALAEFGRQYEQNPDQAKRAATATAAVLARELREVGVDFSFAPVVDLDKGFNTVIGDRAFHRDKYIVYELAAAFIRGLRSQGMKAVIKHFPGHGHVTEDSHFTLPVDQRSYAAIEQDDLYPFIELIKQKVDAIMPAHIVFPAVDPLPVGFSSRWLKDILRTNLGFTGIIISDDLSMAGARQTAAAITPTKTASIAFQGESAMIDRVISALTSGCDLLLLCNDRKSVLTVIDQADRFISLGRCVDCYTMQPN